MYIMCGILSLINHSKQKKKKINHNCRVNLSQTWSYHKIIINVHLSQYSCLVRLFKVIINPYLCDPSFQIFRYKNIFWSRLLIYYLVGSRFTFLVELILALPAIAQQIGFASLAQSITASIQNTQMLYTLTSIWELCTPNTGQNMLFHVFTQKM